MKGAEDCSKQFFPGSSSDDLVWTHLSGLFLGLLK